jgi:fumarylacetoacetate (FAA) hydrolase
MKLATLKDGNRDGRLAVVSRDLQRACLAGEATRTMRDALDDWERMEPALKAVYEKLNAGQQPGAFAFDPARAMAPLPRTHQFIDASAFMNHGKIMQKASGANIKIEPGTCLLVPRQADDFRGPTDDYEFPTEADQCDFEGEFAVITGDIAIGATPAQALASVRLVTVLNDVSMRRYQFKEIQMGFGLIRSKTATVFAPVAVTPDELGDAWVDGRIHLDLHVSRNGEWFGHPNGREMDFSLGDLLAYIAYNRRLGAGFVLGTGTVSNAGHEQVGSACLAERRALETIAHGVPTTAWMQYGERLRFEARDAQGGSIFGAIDMKFVPPVAIV